ncbi:hypothetical protein H310_10481 [Aphanomyces invadans]|uniref:NUDE domain-containing protein n=1 Tax=Aphanomyces invadans TaxID=157072 RepID=A0A024TRS0_9STRA|nr:hypothetical protein H310_10481 [Aphanomyces invadans]ETV96316.1 hypothetical protein H310_10481 [Aphanomyces invadans]|eukprot:XP_008875108.1 hypothetical protein H310_10481 [Aphanomyces invadans]
MDLPEKQSMIEDLTHQVRQREADLRALQQEHDDYVASSCDIERELEAEVLRLESMNTKLVEQIRRGTLDVEAARAVADSASKDLSKLHIVVAELMKANAELKSDVQRLEQRNDDLERRERELQASIEDLEHHLDVSVEQAVFLRQENDELIVRLREDPSRGLVVVTGSGASVNPLSTDVQLKYGTDAIKSSAASPPMSPPSRQRSSLYVTTPTASTCGPHCSVM